MEQLEDKLKRYKHPAIQMAIGLGAVVGGLAFDYNGVDDIITLSGGVMLGWGISGITYPAIRNYLLTRI